MTRRSSAADQIELFAAGVAAEPALPPGFAYREDVITASEERALVEQIVPLPFKPFAVHGYLGNRRVVSFGWRYNYGARAVQPAAPIPSFLLPLRERAAQFAGASRRKASSTCWSPNMPKAPVSAGIATKPNSPMSSRSRCSRPARCASVAGKARAGSAPRGRSGHARLTCYAARRAACASTQYPQTRLATLFRDLP